LRGRPVPEVLAVSPVLIVRRSVPLAASSFERIPPIRIVIIAPPWVAVPPTAYGGTEAVLDTLARGLHAAGHEVLLFTTGDSTCPVPKASVLARAIGVGVGGSATELRHVIHAYEAAAGADVVHDHTLVGPVYADRFADLPVVTTNHGPFKSELGDYYRAIGDRTPIIAISRHQASTAGGTPIAAVIHHGVDFHRFPSGPGDGGYAVFLGRMCPEKGVDAAIRVARLAGVPLRIVAKMSEAAEQLYFDRKVKPLLGGDIEYVGELGGNDKLALVGSATCLLNPIAWPEPFGMVMVEALACGTPVVATPMGAVPEIVDHGVTGFICSGEKSLAKAVVAADSINREACRSAVAHRFSAERMVAKHVDLYESAAHGRALPLVA
jgi:glycosyltransferase involved in cell wall biosynthesis